MTLNQTDVIFLLIRKMVANRGQIRGEKLDLCDTLFIPVHFPIMDAMGTFKLTASINKVHFDNKKIPLLCLFCEDWPIN